MSEGMSWSATNISGLWTSQADLLGSVAGHLEPRDVMDYLFQEHALSEDDMELIKAEVTRKRRCKSLIKQLLLRENNIQALYTFVESLRFDYDFLTADVSKQVRSYLEPTNVSSSVMIHPFGKHCHRAGRRSFCSQPSLVPCQSQHTRGKHVLKMYNSLSGVLNRGEIDTFESRVRLYLDSDISADVKCIVMYLNACKALFQNDFKEALHMYKNAMMLVPKTEHPVVFEVEMLSVKAWICVKHGKLNKLERIVSSAWQKIISEPRCSGKVAGWICIDYAHLLVALLESANLERAKPLRKRALECLEMASYHFLTDNCKDGPFGFNFALIKYATVLLRCGNRMQFANSSIPQQDFSNAETILRRVEECKNGLPNILRVFYYLARTDLNIRKGNYRRARDYAEDVLTLSSNLQMAKEHDLAVIRLAFLKATLDREPTGYSPSSFDSFENTYKSCNKSVVYKRGWTYEGFIILLIVYVRFTALLTCIGIGILCAVIL